jgi:hypothetical protein
MVVAGLFLWVAVVFLPAGLPMIATGMTMFAVAVHYVALPTRHFH